ncbi:MAG: PilZ domain-containing protein [Desulfobulbaceae bacterium]|nr:PilZ domain-containing protein [Desulfobulbaceae bacterium]
MITQYELQERRNEKRFVMREGTFAFLHHPANKIGHIIDISMSGLAFSYFSLTTVPLGAEKVDLLTDDGFLLEDIPFILVDDVVIRQEVQYSSDDIIMRRHCLQFKDLSPENYHHLKSFIENRQVSHKKF